MDENTFQRKMADLFERIRQMPEERPDGNDPRETAGRKREELKLSVVELQESLDYLRLSVKYLVFDLEATRRENKQLRALLERRPEGEA